MKGQQGGTVDMGLGWFKVGGQEASREMDPNDVRGIQGSSNSKGRSPGW